MTLLAAYHFDDVAASTIVDVSGNGYDIDLSGTTGAQVAGLDTGAFGKTGAGTVALPAGLRVAAESDDRTLMFDALGTRSVWWVRWNDTSIDSGVWGILSLDAANLITRARTQAHGSPTPVNSVIGALSASVRHHHAITYKRSTGVLSRYYDGALIGTQTFTAGTPLFVGAGAADIGEFASTGPAIDNLRIYDEALDDAAIAALAGTPVTAAADLELPIDPASEVDAAQPLGRAKARALGTAAAVETAQPLGRHKALALGTAVETATAQQLARGKARALGTAAETATAGVLGAAKARALGTAVERDTAVAIQHDEPSTPTVGGNGLQVEEITARCVSFVAGLGVVEDVNGGDIRHMIGGGLKAGIFVSDLTTIRSSGLDAVSVRLEQTIRLYERLQVEPSDVLDVETLRAVDAICNAFVENFEIDGIVRQVDVLGEHGQPLRARPGFLTVQEQDCRIADVMVPLICDDVWIYGGE
jgi:hypothetical protein